MKIFRIHVPHAGNVGVIEVGVEFMPLEIDLYEMIKKGYPLPLSYKIELDELSRKRTPSKDFLSFSFSVLASDKIDPRMRALLQEYCYSIAMIAPFGNYTYYLPKTLIDAIDYDRSEVRKYDNDLVISEYDFSNLVLDDSKIGNSPIFQLLPLNMTGVNYVTEEFVKLYKECRCKGIRFIPIDTTSELTGSAQR